MGKIIVQQPAVLHYRVPVFQILRQHFGERFSVHCGDLGTDPTHRTVSSIEDFTTVYKNRFFLGGRLLWQMGMVKGVIDAEIVVLNFNIRHLSTWWILIRRRIRGMRTVLWGHSEGRARHVVFLRRLMVAFSSGFIAYTESERKRVKQLYPNVRTWALGNSCVWRSDCSPGEGLEYDIKDIIYVGRFTKAKRPELLLEAFRIATDAGTIPESARLIMIGEGPEKERLLCKVKGTELANRVDFPGMITDHNFLRKYYETAICSVSPGYAGLSVIQSLAYGVLFLLPVGEKHSPEIEACEEGFNAKYFKKEDPVDLARILEEVFAERLEIIGRRKLIAEKIAERYSYESMAANFISVVRAMTGRSDKSNSERNKASNESV